MHQSTAQFRSATKSPDYAPKVNRGICKDQHIPNPPKPPAHDQQQNPILRSIAKPTVWAMGPDPKEQRASKYPPSTRPLSSYGPDQIRVLKVRYYHETHIRQKNDRQVSSELDVRIPDLHLLCEKKDGAVFRPVNGSEELADFRAARPLGDDDLQ